MSKLQKLMKQYNQSTPGQESGESGQKETKLSRIMKAHSADVDESTVRNFILDSGNYQQRRSQTYNDLDWQTGSSSDSSLWDNEESKNMTATAKKVRTWAWANKDQLDAEYFTNLTSYVEDFLNYQTQSTIDYRLKTEGIKKYETQEEYDQAVQEYERHQEYYDKYTGMSVYQMQIAAAGLPDGEEKQWLVDYAAATPKTKEELQKDLTWLKKQEQYLTNQMQTASKELAVLKNQLEAATPGTPKYDELKRQYEDRIKQYQSMGILESIEGVEDEITKVQTDIWDTERAIKYYDLPLNVDYAKKSQYVEEGKLGQAVVNRTQHLVNNPEAAQNWDMVWTKEKYWPTVAGTTDILARVKELWGYENLHLMEEAERKNFNYLYNTQGEEAAKEYLDWLQYTLNARSKQKVQTWAAARTRDIPVLSQVYTSLMSTPVALLSGEGFLDAVGQKTINDISGEWKPVDYNRDPMMAAVASGSVRDTVSADIQKNLGTTAAKAYQIGMGIQDSAAIAGLSMINPALGTVGTMLLGGASATQTMLDAVERGASDEEAIGLGLLSGALEVFFEKYELDQLLDGMKIAAKGAGKAAWVRPLVRQSLSEAVGEGGTEVGNILADVIVMAEKSNWQVNIEKYINEQNMSPEEAKKQAFIDAALQVGEAAAGGFVSGMIMSGGMTGINYAAGTHQQNTGMRNAAVDEFYAKKYRNDIPGLVQSVLQIDPENQLAQSVQKKLDNGENVTDQELRQLSEPLAAAEMEKTASARLKELGESGDLAALSKAAVKSATGQSLTAQEQAALKNSDYAAQVAEELSKSLRAEKKQAAKYGRDTVKDQKKAQKTLEKALNKYSKEAKKGKLAQDTELEETIDPEGVSEDTDVVTEAGAAVKVQSVDFQNGRLTLRTEDGQTVAASSAIYDTEAEKVVYEAVAQLEGIIDGKTATKLSRNLIRQINEGDRISDHYIQAVTEAYRLGYEGPDIEEVRANADIASELTERQLNYAYNMGKKYAEDTKSARSNNGTKAADNGTKATDHGTKAADNGTKATDHGTKDTKIRKKTAKRSKAPDGKSYDNVQFEGKVKSWGDKQRADVEFLNFVAKDIAGGVTVHVFESFKGEDGNRYYYDSDGKLRNAPNGRYIHASGDIYLDLNAGDSGEGLVLNTFAHELYHHIEQWSPAKARKLAQFLVKEQGLESVGAMVDAQIRKAEAAGHGVKYFMQQGMTRTAAENTVRSRAFSDFVADSLEAVFTKGDAMETLQRLKKSDRGLFDKIKAFVDQWVSKLKKYYRGNNTISTEGQITAQLDTFQQLQELFMEALADAGENYRNADTVAAEKNTAEGGEMYMDRMTTKEIQTIQNIGRKSVNQFLAADIKATERFAERYWSEMGIKSPFFRAWFGDWRTKDCVTKVQVATQRGDARGVQKNIDTGWDIQISGMVFNETKRHKDSYNVAARPYLPYIRDIVSKAFLLDTYGFDTAKVKSENSLLMHSLYAVADIGNGPEILKLYVEEMNDPNTDNTKKRAYQLQNIEKYQSQNGSSQKTASSISSATGNIRTLSDLYVAVKQFDKNFAPNPPSYVVNADGTPKIMYHGTNANWTAYDLAKNKNQVWGEGIYLAETAERASLYGDQVKALYVKALYNNRDAKRLGVKRDHVQMKNGDILVFSTEQIKSATDNIGTFDGTNSDIRFSDRNATPTTNHEILMNATEENVQTDWEKKLLRRYQDKAQEITDAKDQLEYTKQLIKELSPDVKYNSKVMELRGEKRSLEIQLRKLNGELRNMTEQKPLQDLLKREKQRVLKTAHQRYKNKLYEQRLSAEVKQSELLREHRETKAALQQQKSDYAIMEEEFIRIVKAYEEMEKTAQKTADQAAQLQGLKQKLKEEVKKHREDSKVWETKFNQLLREYERAGRKIDKLEQKIAEQRKAAQDKVDSRKRTEMRHQICRDVKSIYKLYNRGKDVNNVKEEMKEFVFHALSSAELLLDDLYTDDDMIRNGVGIKLSPQANGLLQRAKKILHLLDNPPTVSSVALLDEWNRREQRLKLELSEIKTEMQTEFRRVRWEQKGSIVSMVMQDLCDAYKELETSKEPHIRNAFQPFVLMHLEGIRERLKATRVEDMTLDELTEIHEAYTMVLESIRNANKAFCASRSIDYMAKRLISDFQSEGQTMSKSAVRNLARNVSEYVGWNYEKLHYALERVGSATFTQLFVNLADAENIIMQDIAEAKAFQQKLEEKYHYNQWSINKKVDQEFVDNRGHRFQLTLGEVMLLYAYTRRGNVWKQLQVGGFVIERKGWTERKSATTYKLTPEQCLSITGTLTAEQKHFVEDMQKYLSDVMGGKGNEVSMKLYGVKLYNDPNYCPVHVAGEYQARAKEATARKEAGFESLSNSGFTKTKNIKATAPIVLESFMDIWVDHVNEMSRYHGAVPALEDIRRVMNYSDYSDADADSVSVQAMMKNRYGKQAVSYFTDLYREVNSGAVIDKLQSLPKKALSVSRKLAVAYSMSVVIQQPASISRAFAMIDPKYFAGFSGGGASAWGLAKTVTNHWTQKQTAAYAEMVKYAPGVTLAKEIGGFDASGGGIRNYLMDTGKDLATSMKTGTAGEKLQAVGKKVDDNFVANLPNLADKIAWIEIWNACKREIKDKHRSMDIHGEPYMKLVGKRFTEVIRATQVYDSVFSKSPMLKSKSVAVQYLVSYMNEPNVVVNMVESAVRDIRNGDLKQAARKLCAVTRSIIFGNVLKALIYAMRDDDEDESYIEKYVQALAGNLAGDFIGFNYIPFVRDVWSLLQGYDVERPDVGVISDLIASIKKYNKVHNKDISKMDDEELEEWEKQCTDADWRLVGAIVGCFGIPLKNVYRDIRGVINCIRIGSKNAGKTTRESFWDSLYQGVVDVLPWHDQESKSDKLYEALTEGNTKYLDRIQVGYLNSEGELKSGYYTALRKGLRDHDPRIQEAANARKEMDTDVYLEIIDEIVAEGHFTEKDVVAAIRSEYNQLKDEDSVKLLFEAMNAGDRKAAEQLKSNFVNDEGEFSESSYQSAIRKGLREYDPRILEAAEARLDKDHTTANKILNQIVQEGNFTRSDISAAISAEYHQLKDE